jgi:hypothetical protein
LAEAIGLVVMPGSLVGLRGRLALGHLGPYDLLGFGFAAGQTACRSGSWPFV